MTVFDFDKTLTYQDTLAGFYREVALNGTNNRVPYSFKKFALIFFAVFYKLRLINNTQLKKAGVWLFLKGCAIDELKRHSDNYAQKIKLNQVHEVDFQEIDTENKMIITASFVDYVQPIFPNIRVFGSSLLIKDGRVCGLARNMYKQEKVVLLSQLGINRIGAVYTDSYSDKPLMDIADNCFLVIGEKVEKIK